MAAGRKRISSGTSSPTSRKTTSKRQQQKQLIAKVQPAQSATSSELKRLASDAEKTLSKQSSMPHRPARTIAAASALMLYTPDAAGQKYEPRKPRRAADKRAGKPTAIVVSAPLVVVRASLSRVRSPGALYLRDNGKLYRATGRRPFVRLPVEGRRRNRRHAEWFLEAAEGGWFMTLPFPLIAAAVYRRERDRLGNKTYLALMPTAAPDDPRAPPYSEDGHDTIMSPGDETDIDNGLASPAASAEEDELSAQHLSNAMAMIDAVAMQGSTHVSSVASVFQNIMRLHLAPGGSSSEDLTRQGSFAPLMPCSSFSGGTDLSFPVGTDLPPAVAAQLPFYGSTAQDDAPLVRNSTAEELRAYAAQQAESTALEQFNDSWAGSSELCLQTPRIPPSSLGSSMTLAQY